MTSRILTRRQMLLRGSSLLGGLLLAGCDRLTNAPSFRRVLESAEGLTYRSQDCCWDQGRSHGNSANRTCRRYSGPMAPAFRIPMFTTGCWKAGLPTGGWP